jgi:hypothetical protein
MQCQTFQLIADWCLHFIVKEQNLTPCGWGGEGGMQISTVFSTVISTVNSNVDYCPTPELLTAMPNILQMSAFIL